MSAGFRTELEAALAAGPRPTPPSAFHASLAEALTATPRDAEADEDVIDLRFGALLADALHRWPESVVDLRDVPEGEAVARTLDTRLT